MGRLHTQIAEILGSDCSPWERVCLRGPDGRVHGANLSNADAGLATDATQWLLHIDGSTYASHSFTCRKTTFQLLCRAQGTEADPRPQLEHAAKRLRASFLKWSRVDRERPIAEELVERMETAAVCEQILVIGGDGALLASSPIRSDGEDSAALVANWLRQSQQKMDQVIRSPIQDAFVVSDQVTALFTLPNRNLALVVIGADCMDLGVLQGAVRLLLPDRSCKLDRAVERKHRKHPLVWNSWENCGEAVPRARYLHAARSRTFHLHSCPAGKRIETRKIRWLFSRAEALENGFVPCRHCDA